MKEFIDLSVPVPCHEKWDNFRPTPQGRHCSSCNKEVVDFTRWSEGQIKDYFKSGKAATCGRFRKDQLKTYLPNGVESRHKFVPLSALGIGLLLTSNHAQASEKPRAGMEIVSFQEIREENEAATSDTIHTKIITGTVVDGDDHSPLPGVNILLKGTDTGAVSDVDGNFTLEIQDPGKTDVLVFSYLGYETAERSVPAASELSVTLNPDMVVLGAPIVAGGICVKRWAPRTIWWRIKNIFR